MSVLVNLNGKISPPEEAKVSIMDRGFLFGDGVYEAGRSYDGVFLYLEEHWERFRSSAGKLLLEVPWSDEELTAGLHQVATQNGEPNTCFRTIVTRGRIDTLGLGMTETEKPTLAHVIFPIPQSFDDERKTGVHLTTSEIRRNPSTAQDPNIKTSNYLNSLLAHQEVKKRGGGLAIMCDAKDQVTEGTNFSIFGVKKDKTVITPALDVGILDSITRRHVLNLAKADYQIEESHTHLDEFQLCEEVFVVSSTREIMPVALWDDKKYPIDGKVSANLHQKLQEEIKSYVAAHPKF